MDDGYTFSIQQRPPTKTLDLLTSYLEVRYADVLLQKDAAQSMQRQLALESLQHSSGLGSELLEQPAAALTAARTLSPEEHEAVSKTLDDLLGGKQYRQYREAVLQLYCDGLVGWGELQECWAAAQAGEELTAAAEAPVSIAGRHALLFAARHNHLQAPSACPMRCVLTVFNGLLLLDYYCMTTELCGGVAWSYFSTLQLHLQLCCFQSPARHTYMASGILCSSSVANVSSQL